MLSIFEYLMVLMKFVKFLVLVCEIKFISNNCWFIDNVVRNVCRWSCFKILRMLCF